MVETVVACNMAARTDVGLVKTGNEDCLMMADLVTGRSLPESYRISYPLGENALLMVVADGVGGVDGGEVAGEMTVLTIKDALMRLPRHISQYDRLTAAVEEANNVIWNMNKVNQQQRNPASTVTACLVEGDHAFIAEVGDSRAYLMRGGLIKQVTTDQSFVAQLISRGIIRPEQAARHPRKNVILQAIGISEAIKVAVSMFRIQRGDCLLLCTNGLSDMVRSEEMMEAAEKLSPESACTQLVELAKQRGGRDNITMILGKFDGNGLGNQAPVGSLTDVLEQLSSYDPNQKVEKSHIRTNLLGNASFMDRFYGSDQYSNEPKQKNINNLSSFPTSAKVVEECKRLTEYIDYCHQSLQGKTDQVKQATRWLESQGKCYNNLPETMAQIQSGLTQIAQLKRAIEHLQNIFEKKT